MNLEDLFNSTSFAISRDGVQSSSSNGLSRVTGRGLQLDVSTLEMNTAGGMFRFTPTQIDFAKGTGKWITAMDPGKVHAMLISISSTCRSPTS